MKLVAGRSQDLDDAAALVRAGAELSEVGPMVEAVAEGLGEDDIRRTFDELQRRVRR